MSKELRMRGCFVTGPLYAVMMWLGFLGLLTSGWVLYNQQYDLLIMCVLGLCLLLAMFMAVSWYLWRYSHTITQCGYKWDGNVCTMPNGHAGVHRSFGRY